LVFVTFMVPHCYDSYYYTGHYWLPLPHFDRFTIVSPTSEVHVSLTFLVLTVANEQAENICSVDTFNRRVFFQWLFQPHSGPWPFIQFRNHFSQTVGLLGRVISLSQGPLPEHRTTQTQNKRIHIPNIHAVSGIRTHDPSVPSGWRQFMSACLGTTSREDETVVLEVFRLSCGIYFLFPECVLCVLPIASLNFILLYYWWCKGGTAISAYFHVNADCLRNCSCRWLPRSLNIPHRTWTFLSRYWQQGDIISFLIYFFFKMRKVV
jgi:hypothetical protein